jgi:RND family efflux transporter MFP subunit
MNLLNRYLFAGITFFLTSFSTNAETDFVTAHPSIHQKTISGFTRARSTIILSTEVAGKITHVFADIGDAIPATGKFACLDDTFVKIDIESASNDIAQHAIDLRFYKKQVARHQQLVATNSAAISLLDDLKRKQGNSQRAMQGDTLRKRRLEELLRRHCIKSPAGWRIIERFVEPGQWIDTGTAVAKVGDYSHLLVPLTLSAKEFAVLKLAQQQIRVFLPEVEQHALATIEHISPAFDEQSHKIRVDLLLKEGISDFRGGQRVELTLDMAGKTNSFRISQQALDERFEEIWVERIDGKKIRVSLLGYFSDNVATITSTEIKPGDQFKIIRP